MHFLVIFSLISSISAADESPVFTSHQQPLKVFDSVGEFVYKGNGSLTFVTTPKPRLFPFLHMKVSLGNQARDDQFPFVAELAINTATSGILCTGSLIASNWILTARHCIADTNAETVLIQLGSADRASQDRVKIFANTFVYMTASTGRSPDISLFKLVSDAPTNENVRPVRLPSLAQEFQKFEGSTVTAIGWGSIGNGQFSQYLQFTTFSILPEKECYLAANVICSQPRTGRSSIEGGDSGGPLVIYEDGTPTQIGVNVFTARAGTSLFQGSTRVTDFLGFIRDVTDIELRKN